MIKCETEKVLMAAAQGIWRQTYGSGKSEAQAMEVVSQAVEVMNEGAAHDTFATDFARLAFAVQWLHGGCVTLTTTHKFAAALAASRAREPDVLDDVTIPAKAFRVEIPNGILHSEEHNRDCTQANVAIMENGQGLFLMEGEGPVLRNGLDRGTRSLSTLPAFYTPGLGGRQTIAEVLADREDDEDHFVVSQDVASQQTPDEIEVKRRMFALARRIVAGLLLTFSHTTNWREQSRPEKSGRRDPRDPPRHRVIFIGRPIEVDARPAIAKYLGARGKHAPPSVQTLVRGHHKRQVIGMGRTGRKVIWVEPYWRGPEAAPILSRPYRVGGAAS